MALILYNLYRHPLSRFPGPKFAAASRLPFAWATFKGSLIYYIDDIHSHHGPIVRIAPNELTIIEPKAWTDIYAHRPQLPKDPANLIQPLNGVHSLFSADDANHQRQRRILANAFSNKSVREQEPLIGSYIDSMIQTLHEHCARKPTTSIDVEKVYGHLILDVVGDLTFGESFHCLEKDDEHPWVANLFISTKVSFLLACLRNFPLLGTIATGVLLTASTKRRQAFFDYISSKIDRRLAVEVGRRDFISYVTDHMDAKGITRDELQTNAVGFILAGSESPASTLSAATLLLLQNPEKLQKLNSEICGAFKKKEEITLSSVLALPYLRAVLDETLRLGQPAPSHSPRIVPPGGQTIAGHWIPGGVSTITLTPVRCHSQVVQ